MAQTSTGTVTIISSCKIKLFKELLAQAPQANQQQQQQPSLLFSSKLG
jgi:hypothetical protein